MTSATGIRAERNKAVTARLFDAYRAGETSSYDEFFVEGFVQHNPQEVDGLQAAKDFFDDMGPIDVEVHRMIAEGDYVVVHAHLKTMNMAAMDIYLFNEEGKIIEHWDVLQPIPETTASGNDMFAQVS